jgi:hypothetical protein
MNHTTISTAGRLTGMKLFPVLALALALLAGCKGGNKKQRPDVSGIAADITLHRYDQDFFNLDSLNPEAGLKALQQKEPVFTQQYLEAYTPLAQEMRKGVPVKDLLKQYLSDIRPLYQYLQERYSNMSGIEKELEQGFRYMKHYFTDFRIPAVYTTVEGLNPTDPEEMYGITYFNDTLSISLQMFGGVDAPFYDPNFYYDYLRRRFEPAYIVRNGFRAIINSRFPAKINETSLVDQMVDAGKRQYLLEQVLPDTKPEVRLGYTEKQLKDCFNNEKLIWSHFINNNLLFGNEAIVNREYVGENPYTKELGTDSPGNIGAFVGLQIVKKYMDKNDGVSLSQLMQTDAKTIFDNANYKPE